jgi:nucleotide-binding universal stress UspA family protein
MRRTLVVPLDGSDFALRALPVAQSIADPDHVPLHIVGVARADDELAWMFDHVHDAAKHATNGAVPTVDVIVDPDPATVLLRMADEPGTTLCFAGHDHPRLAAWLMHSVGSSIMARATRPYVVVGEAAAGNEWAHDVVVAIDGVDDPEPLLAAGANWAARLRTQLRIVTVFEPVLADLRRPSHFTRHHGPAGDPDAYLDGIRQEVGRFGVTNVSVAAIADPISPAAGLHTHLVGRPAQLVVLGGRNRGAHPVGGTVRTLLDAVSAPLLVVNG